MDNSFEGFLEPNTNFTRITPVDNNVISSVSVPSSSSRLGTGNFDNPVALSSISDPITDSHKNRSNLSIVRSDLLNTTNNSQALENITKLCYIIEPISNINNQLKRNTFFNNDVKMSKCIYISEFGKFNISQISKNFAKKLATVELAVEQSRLKTATKLTEITQLGDWVVKCRRPRFDKFCYCVIGPIGCDTDEQDVAMALVSEGYRNAEVKHIMKEQGKVKTVYMRVGLEVNKLPEYVYLIYQRFAVRPYIGKPWQCYNCQKFGHNARDCRSKVHCVVCSGSHAVKLSPIKSKESVKCTNCGGNHTASYGGCSYMKNDREVEKVRAECYISYREAVLKIKHDPQSHHDVSQSTRPSVALTNQNSIPVSRRISHVKALTSNLKVNLTDSSTQTEGSSNNLEVSHSFALKLATAFVQVLQLRNSNVTNEAQIKSVLNIMKETMGVSIDANKLQCNVPKATITDKDTGVGVTSIPETPDPVSPIAAADVSCSGRGGPRGKTSPKMDCRYKKKTVDDHPNAAKKRGAEQLSSATVDETPLKKKPFGKQNNKSPKWKGN